MSPASKHTPGPWHVCYEGDRDPVIRPAMDGDEARPNGALLAVLHTSCLWDVETTRANAALIASAPSLLAERDALRKALADLVQAQDDIDEGRVHDCLLRSDAIDRARAALALGGAS